MSDWRRALQGRPAAVAFVVGLTMLRLLTDLGMGASVATDVYLLVLTAAGLRWCVMVLVDATSAERPAATSHRRSLVERPSRLVTIEDAAEWATRSGHVRDSRLRPLVRYAVADRLGRGGLLLGPDPAVSAALGPYTSALVESSTVAEPGTPGLTAAEVSALTEELTGLDRRIQDQTEQAQPVPTGEQR